MRKINEQRINEVYEYITQVQYTESRTPSIREISKACNISGSAGALRAVRCLEERGMISRTYSQDKKVISIPNNLELGKTAPVSIIGTCACGEPITAVENVVATVALPVEIFGSEKHFILYAKGNSMIKKGIFDGDLMVVRVQNTANAGDVVIARVNDDEATAKILAIKNGKYYLKPANDEVDEMGKKIYEDIYPEGEWSILGVVDNVIHNPNNGII